MRPQDWRLSQIILAAWTLGGVLLSVQYYSTSVSRGSPLRLVPVVLAGFSEAYLWAAVTFAAVWLSRRFPLVPGRWAVSVPVHVAAGLGLMATRVFVGLMIIPHLVYLGPRTFTQSLVRLPEYFIRYWLLLGAVHALEYARRYHEREITAANLKTELATAKLQMLNVQLQPHFLFNSLHAISSLMYSNVAAADRMLSSVAELLRRALTSMDVQQVTLSEELEFLAHYVEIEQMRLRERLFVEIEVDPGAHRALVPHMILQPLVENAVRHSIAPRPAGGSLHISARTSRDRLLIEVIDDGPGISVDAATKGSGIGLSNTEARLAHLYGPDHRFEFRSEVSGFVVEIEIPLQYPTGDTPAGQAL